MISEEQFAALQGAIKTLVGAVEELTRETRASRERDTKILATVMGHEDRIKILEHRDSIEALQDRVDDIRVRLILLERRGDTDAAPPPGDGE